MWYVRLYLKMRGWELETLKMLPGMASPSFVAMGFGLPTLVALFVLAIASQAIDLPLVYVDVVFYETPIVSMGLLAILSSKEMKRQRLESTD